MSILPCTYGFRLLCTLMDYEIMRDAENYIRVFCSTNPTELRCLHLGYHGTKHMECKVHIFKLLQIFIVKNPLMSQSDISQLVSPEYCAPLISAFNSWEALSSKSLPHRGSLMPIRNLEDELEFMNLDIMNRRSTNDKKNSINLDSSIANILNFFKDKSRKWKRIQTTDSMVRIKHYKGVYIKMSCFLKAEPENVKEKFLKFEEDSNFEVITQIHF